MSLPVLLVRLWRRLLAPPSLLPGVRALLERRIAVFQGVRRAELEAPESVPGAEVAGVLAGHDRRRQGGRQPPSCLWARWSW